MASGSLVVWVDSCTVPIYVVGLRDRGHAADGCCHLPSRWVGGPGDSCSDRVYLRGRCHGEVRRGEALRWARHGVKGHLRSLTCLVDLG